MATLSELSTAEEIHERDMADPDYRAEHERTGLANGVAIRVVHHRTERGLTQTAFGKLVGLRRPHVARLEAGEREPSLSTLVRLSVALGGGLRHRHQPEWRPAPRERVNETELAATFGLATG